MQPVVLTSLSQILRAILENPNFSEEAVYHRNRKILIPWNICPHQIIIVVQMFGALVRICHENAQSDLQTVRNEMQQVFQTSTHPELTAPFMRNLLSRANTQELWNAVQNVWRDVPTPMSNAQAQNAANMTNAEVWIMQCALHPNSGLSDRSKKYVQGLAARRLHYEGEEKSNFGALPPAEGGLKFSIPTYRWALEKLRTPRGQFDLTLTKALLDRFTLVGYAVGEVSKLWKTRRQSNEAFTAENWYSLYHEGHKQMRQLWENWICDPFSTIPEAVRVVMLDVNIKGVWDNFWRAALLFSDRFVNWPTLPFCYLLQATVVNEFLHFTNAGLRANEREMRERIAQIIGKPWPTNPNNWRDIETSVLFQPDLEAAMDSVPPLLDWDDEADVFFFSGFYIDFRPRQAPDNQDQSDRIAPSTAGSAENSPVLPETGADVELVTTGSPVNTATHLRVILDPEENAKCTVCMEKFEMVDFACVGLKKCEHVFHFHCINKHINSETRDMITCPNCRAEICERRDVKAIIEGQ